MSENRFKFKWLAYPLFLIIGVFIGNKFSQTACKQPAPDSAASFNVREGGYKFMNPLLECELAEEVFSELKPFKQAILTGVNEELKAGKAEYISVYFRDLNNGPWIGINERENFSPASLLKLPMAMAYLKLAESNPEILKQTYVFEPGASNYTQQILPAQAMEPGKAYSVEDLIYRSIVYSDNYANQILRQRINPEVIKKIYADFGLVIPANWEEDAVVNVKTYAGLFRMLFNASYLSRENSEKLLQLLNQVQYRQGIVAGVPENVAVAHKFGERADQGLNKQQLHDCGIVYASSRPYLLCVMTKGQSQEDLAKSIAKVSNIVYEEVIKQTK